MNMKNKKLIQGLNDSVFNEIIEIKHIFERFSGKELDITYHFDHNSNETTGESDERVHSADQQCACLYDCESFSLTEASQYPKTYSSFIRNVVVDQDLNLQEFPGFGVNPILQFLKDIPFDNQQMIIQAGGGSGFGFQVYCDDSVWMTAGGGGGGGYLVNNEIGNYTFGGGGGGGIQFANLSQPELFLNESFFSVGGGGGCGTCDNHDGDCQLPSPWESIVTCGFLSDTNAVKGGQLASQLSQLREGLRSCGRVRVEGGGGGGSGTSLCCLPFHVGYGFSFSLHSDVSVSQRLLSSEMDSPQEPWHHWQQQQQQQLSQQYQQSGEAMRYRYDFIGSLLHAASLRCPKGFGDWCCLSQESGQLIQDCLQSNLTDSSNLGSSSSPSCEDIQSNLDKVRWLIDQKSCAQQISNTTNDDRSKKKEKEEEQDQEEGEIIDKEDKERRNERSVYRQEYRLPNPFDPSSPLRFLVKLPDPSQDDQQRQRHFDLFRYENLSFDRFLRDFRRGPYNPEDSSIARHSKRHFQCLPPSYSTDSPLLLESSPSPPVSTYSSSSMILPLLLLGAMVMIVSFVAFISFRQKLRRTAEEINRFLPLPLPFHTTVSVDLEDAPDEEERRSLLSSGERDSPNHSSSYTGSSYQTFP